MRLVTSMGSPMALLPPCTGRVGNDMGMAKTSYSGGVAEEYLPEFPTNL